MWESIHGLIKEDDTTVFNAMMRNFIEKTGISDANPDDFNARVVLLTKDFTSGDNDLTISFLYTPDKITEFNLSEEHSEIKVFSLSELPITEELSTMTKEVLTKLLSRITIYGQLLLES